MTHTFASLAISAAAHAEISALLRRAGYDHAFIGGAVDMTGIGLVVGDTPGEETHHAALQCVGAALGLLPGANLHTDCVPAIERLVAAARTLDRKGYTHTGGVEWRPPIGPPPAWLGLRIKVCNLEEGMSPFIFWVSGKATIEVLRDIEADLSENLDEIFRDGFGDYEFAIDKVQTQYGFEGCIELLGGWEFEQISFLRSPPPPITAPEVSP